MISRYLERPLSRHLESLRQMVFLVGPRQVGKTTLAKALLPEVKEGTNYFNWDVSAHRRRLMTRVFRGDVDFGEPGRVRVVFDEIHKYPRWKNALKGLFDSNEPLTHWIVTGSAGLNVHRKGQDSLVGRSFLYHLCPLSVAELTKREPPMPLNEIVEASFDAREEDGTGDACRRLLEFGGFPEPFLRGDRSFLKRWRVSRLDRLVNQDLASTEHLRNLPLLEHLMFLLPERVGSPLSLNSLREDIEVHFATVKHWIELLERVFYGFLLRPYSGKLARTLRKEPKWYLWDWTEVEDAGIRFENMVAVHLLKYVRCTNDLGLGELALYYVRDKEKREVDFLVLSSRKPALLVECKLSDESPSEALVHFKRQLHAPWAIQLVATSKEPMRKNVGHVEIMVLPAASFLQCLV